MRPPRLTTQRLLLGLVVILVGATAFIAPLPTTSSDSGSNSNSAEVQALALHAADSDEERVAASGESPIRPSAVERWRRAFAAWVTAPLHAAWAHLHGAALTQVHLLYPSAGDSDGEPSSHTALQEGGGGGGQHNANTSHSVSNRGGYQHGGGGHAHHRDKRVDFVPIDVAVSRCLAANRADGAAAALLALRSAPHATALNDPVCLSPDNVVYLRVRDVPLPAPLAVPMADLVGMRVPAIVSRRIAVVVAAPQRPASLLLDVLPSLVALKRAAAAAVPSPLQPLASNDSQPHPSVAPPAAPDLQWHLAPVAGEWPSELSPLGGPPSAQSLAADAAMSQRLLDAAVGTAVLPPAALSGLIRCFCRAVLVVPPEVRRASQRAVGPPLPPAEAIITQRLLSERLLAGHGLDGARRRALAATAHRPVLVLIRPHVRARLTVASAEMERVKATAAAAGFTLRELHAGLPPQEQLLLVSVATVLVGVGGDALAMAALLRPTPAGAPHAHDDQTRCLGPTVVELRHFGLWFSSVHAPSRVEAAAGPANVAYRSVPPEGVRIDGPHVALDGGNTQWWPPGYERLAAQHHHTTHNSRDTDGATHHPAPPSGVAHRSGGTASRGGEAKAPSRKGAAAAPPAVRALFDRAALLPNWVAPPLPPPQTLDKSGNANQTAGTSSRALSLQSSSLRGHRDALLLVKQLSTRPAFARQTLYYNQTRLLATLEEARERLTPCT